MAYILTEIPIADGTPKAYTENRKFIMERGGSNAILSGFHSE